MNFEDNSAWIQATLPVKLGRIGIRRAVQLAPSAYIASAAGCSDLIASASRLAVKGKAMNHEGGP